MTSIPQSILLLSSTDEQQRLQAARDLASSATPQDASSIRAALNREPNRWIRSALARALARLDVGELRPAAAAERSSVSSVEVAQDLREQLYAQAVEETTRTLVHEIEPILGALRLDAEHETRSYQSSRVRLHIERLDDLLEALHSLRCASASPKITDFNLTDVLKESLIACAPAAREVVASMPPTLIVTGDPKLIRIAFENGLRNAREAVATLGDRAPKDAAIVVSAGSTDTDFWIVILDQGEGLKANALRVFDVGATTKSGHLGMGLATALQAMRSMEGTVSLSPSSSGSTRFELRWPRARA